MLCRKIHHVQRLAARIAAHRFPVQHSGTAGTKLAFQPGNAQVKPLLDQRRTLDGAGNIHGKGDQRLCVSCQQLALAPGAAVAGGQYIHYIHRIHAAPPFPVFQIFWPLRSRSILSSTYISEPSSI